MNLKGLIIKREIDMLLMGLLFLLFLASFKPWFLWSVRLPVFSLLCVFAFSGYFFINKKKINPSQKQWLLIALLIAAKLYCNGNISLKGYAVALLTSLPIIGLLLLSNYEKNRVLKFITRGFAIIVSISIIFWLLYCLGFPLHNFGRIAHPANARYVYDNYFFFIDNLLRRYRFCGVFLEPGHLGMLSVLIVYANRFNLKDYNVTAALIAALLTMSLVAYVLIFVYIIFYLISNYKTAWRYNLIIIISGITFFIFFKNYKEGDNAIYQLIIKRLEYNDKTKNINGFNRFSPRLTAYYNSIKDNGEIWAGIGFKKYTDLKFGNNSGYKVFLIQYGVIGALFVFLFYLLLAYFNLSKNSFILLSVYILVFLQRAYPLLECELILFVTAVSAPFIKKND